MPKKKDKVSTERLLSEAMSELGKRSGKRLGAAGRKERAKKAAAARWGKNKDK